MPSRAYSIFVEIHYTTSGDATTLNLTEEMKRCERSIRSFLKERSAREIDVTVTYAEVDDEGAV